MRIFLRERDRPSRRQTVLLDERTASTAAPAPPAVITLSESSDLVLRLYPDHPLSFQARVVVGNVRVASTLESDRPDFLLQLFPDGDGGEECFACSGRLFRDWVGQTELSFHVRHGDHWQRVLLVGLRVTAGKIEQEAFEALCADLANHSAAILLDVWGKTFLGLEPERRPGETAPVAVLQRVRQAIDQMATSLREIAHQPAYRLKTRRVREPALAGQSVSDLTLEETCLDPTIAVPTSIGVQFREQIREVAAPHFDLAENRLIAGFLHFLMQQLNELRNRLLREIELRQERRAYRHRRTDDGSKTWWESEDLPRIEELRHLLDNVAAMEREVAGLRRHPFLPREGRLRKIPPATPLIRAHRAYASAFKVIVAHFTAYRIRLDDEHLVLRAKSLPVLYEWWCVLEVLRTLQGCLRLCPSGPGAAGSPFLRSAGEQDRFVIEFALDQAVDFEDGSGQLVRLRYNPRYRSPAGSMGLSYGLLGPESERTPDIAIEVFPAGAAGLAPELILVLDAKYSSDPQRRKLDEVRYKYGKIGVFNTGRVLSRQVWALTPSPPEGRTAGYPEWAAFCSVDNCGFWSEQFDMQSHAAGVVQAKPRMPAGRSPLDALLRLLLKRAGMRLKTEME